MEQHREKGPNDNVLETPVWVVVIRGFQLFFSIVILGMAATLMHDAYLDEEGFSLAMALFTWVAVLYILLSEKMPRWRKTYNIFAVLAIDAIFVILWLSAFGATAARRAAFNVDVRAGRCVDDGSLIDSKTCVVSRSNVILFKSGAALLSAIAGVGALNWLLFIATLVWTVMMYLRGRKEGRFQLNSSTTTTVETANFQMESKPLQQMEAQPTGQHAHDQYQGQAPVPYQQPPSQYQQQTSPLQSQGTYSPDGQQQYQQYPPQPYQTPPAYGNELDGSQHGTPSPATTAHPYQQMPYHQHQ